MASETDYKEAPFGDDDGLQKDVPVKVHIIAPSTLPEGYSFEAEVGAPGAKKTINVEVVSTIFSHVVLFFYVTSIDKHYKRQKCLSALCSYFCIKSICSYNVAFLSILAHH